MVQEGADPSGVLPSLRALFERLVGAYFVLAPGNQIVHWNAAAEALLGVPASRALGRPCWDVLRGRDPFGNDYCSPTCPILRHRDEGKPVRPHELTVEVAGRHRALDCTVTLLRDDASDGVYLVYHLQTSRPHASTREASTPQPAPRIVAREGETGSGPGKLTKREREILIALANGEPTNEIASRCGISEVTVRNHVQNILRKLGVHSKVEAIIFAHRSGLLPS